MLEYRTQKTAQEALPGTPEATPQFLTANNRIHLVSLGGKKKKNLLKRYFSSHNIELVGEKKHIKS